jgi:hypothetical protein
MNLGRSPACPDGPIQNPNRRRFEGRDQVLPQLGKRSISADIVIRFGIYFGLPAQFWINLQAD